jgi:hypothetical protein
LKSDELIGLIELYDLNILYHIDTLHENIPDSYSVRADKLAFELLFDENQTLTTIFHDITADIPLEVQAIDVGVPLYKSLKEAQQASKSLGASFDMREDVVIPELDLNVSWAKLTLQDHSRHYQYSSRGLERLTLSLRKDRSTDGLS